jgi:hypothetical protein
VVLTKPKTFRLLVGQVESSIERTDFVEFGEDEDDELALDVTVDEDEEVDDDEVEDDWEVNEDED